MKQLIFYMWLLLLSVCVPGHTQTGLIHGDLLHNPAWGARAAGMARAVTAIQEPTSSGSYNPATLAGTQQFHAVASLKYQTASATLDELNSSALQFYTLQHTGEASINLLGFAVPINMGKTRMAAGLYLRNMADLATRYAWRTTKKSENRSQETEIKRQGALYGLTSCFALSPFRQFNIGVNITLLGGGQQIDTSYVELATPNRYFSRTQWKNRFSGVSIEFGYLWQIFPHFTFGQKIIFPYQLSLTDIEFNSLSSKKSYSDHLSLDIPTVLFTGVGWNITPQLVVSGDYVRRPWNRITGHWGLHMLPLAYSTAHSYHMGLEFQLKNKRDIIPLRLGFYINPKQLYDYNGQQSGDRGNQVISNCFASGFGFYHGSLQLDVGLELEYCSFPSDWYVVGERPLTVRQTAYHLIMTVHYLL
jgi:hypothetical protein